MLYIPIYEWQTYSKPNLYYNVLSGSKQNNCTVFSHICTGNIHYRQTVFWCIQNINWLQFRCKKSSVLSYQNWLFALLFSHIKCIFYSFNTFATYLDKLKHIYITSIVTQVLTSGNQLYLLRNHCCDAMWATTPRDILVERHPPFHPAPAHLDCHNQP